MFTGIIECQGTIEHVEQRGDNVILAVTSEISSELKIDQSLAHDGVCLTVIALEEQTHWVEAVAETLDRTTVGSWHSHDMVNLERAVMVGARLDGHIVQGHVDAKATCIKIEELDGSWMITFGYDSRHAHLLIDKGSIAINGISLTVVRPTENEFTVAIIPYTYEHTNLGQLKVGAFVNLEYDMVGKYIARQRRHS